MTDMSNGGRRQALPRQQPVHEAPRQVTLQFLDDTWERLLNSLERLEQVSEGYRNLTATRLDQHPDRDRITESELDVRWEVHLQITSLERVVKPVVADAQWMIDDFLRWYGGRAGRPPAVTDDYAVPVLHCVMDHRYVLPDLDEVEPTETDILDAAEALGRGLHEADKIEERFLADSGLEATRHSHHRALTCASGLVRLSELNRPLAVHLAGLIDHPKPAKEELR